jgi:hypothetical protein
VALAQPTPVITIGSRKPRAAWASWIAASVLAAAAGALAAGEIRSLAQTAPASGQEFSYLATVTSALIASGGQWLVLWRYRFEAFWWVPATVAADLVSAVVVIPTILHLFLSSSTVPIGASAALLGAAALGASGLLLGTVQGYVLAAGRKEMLLWIGATALGGVLSGALTTLLSRQLLSLPGLSAIAVLAATGTLLTASAQSPVLVKLFQKRP